MGMHRSTWMGGLGASPVTVSSAPLSGYNDPYEVTRPLNITTTKVIMGNPLVQPTIASRGAERIFDGEQV